MKPKKELYLNDAALIRAEQVLANPAATGIDLVHEYQALAESYRKLENRLHKMLAISDSFQQETKIDLRDSQNRLAMAQNAAYIGNYTIDLHTQTWRSDPLFDEIFGIDVDFDRTLANWQQIIHPDDQQWVTEVLKKSALDAETPNLEYRIIRPNNGELRWIGVWGRNFFDNLGNRVQQIGAIQDITERKQAEIELQRHRAHLEELVAERTSQLEVSNKDLEAFSYSVSHDLRAPLRSIDGFSQVLLKNYTEQIDAKGLQYLQKVCRASQHMGNLIDDLLSLSRVTRNELHRVRVNLNAVAWRIINNLKESAPEREVEFVIEEDIWTYADERLLYIALENLLNNAWKFTSKKTQVKIEMGVLEQSGINVIFVRDNGAGFNMAYAHKLFKPFQRLHSTHEFEGTGIGLATVCRIIQRHDGRIWPEAEEGQGACFFFTFEKKRMEKPNG